MTGPAFRRAERQEADVSDMTDTSTIMEATMIRVLEEILLFSCVAAFVTGIVVAAASLLS